MSYYTENIQNQARALASAFNNKEYTFVWSILARCGDPFEASYLSWQVWSHLTNSNKNLFVTKLSHLAESAGNHDGGD